MKHPTFQFSFQQKVANMCILTLPVTTCEPLVGFQWYLILDSCIKISWHISLVVKSVICNRHFMWRLTCIFARVLNVTPRFIKVKNILNKRYLLCDQQNLMAFERTEYEETYMSCCALKMEEPMVININNVC